MKRIRWVGGAIAVVGAVALGTWAVARERAIEPGPPAGGEQSGTAKGGMQGMPGMQGMAGMSMPASGGTVRLSADQIRQLGITFGTAERRRLSGEVRATGVVAIDETRVAQVAPRFAGFVERVYADFTGRVVRRGEPLLAVYSPEVFATMRELGVATRLRSDTAHLVPGVPAGVPTGGAALAAAARQRLQLWGVTDAEIEAALRATEPARTVTIHSPASGVVVEKDVVRGQAIEAGETLYTIADLSSVWVNADIREADAALVRTGTGADVQLAAFPGRAFGGVVTYVQPTLRAETRTVTARITVANAGAQLKPGMFATVTLRPGGREALVVPTAAVVRTGTRDVVFVDMGGGELMPHDVRVGTVAGELTEILAGVDAGDRVVTSAQFLLDSESNLGEVMRSMLGQGASGMQDMGGMPKMPEMPGMERKQP